jgi:hypothetical protein
MLEGQLEHDDVLMGALSEGTLRPLAFEVKLHPRPLECQLTEY